MYGKRGYIGDGVHGNGIYFSTSQYTAMSYGPSQATAFIDKNLARVVKESTLRNMFDHEPASVRQSFSGSDYMSGISSYALYKGYNVIVAPGGNGRQSVRQYGTKYGVDYYVPLTREVLVIREHNRPYDKSKWRLR